MYHIARFLPIHSPSHAAIPFHQCAGQRDVLLTCGSLWHSRCCSQRPRWKALHLDPLYTPRSGNSQDGRTCRAPGGSRRPHTHVQKKHIQDNSKTWTWGHGGHAVTYNELPSGRLLREQIENINSVRVSWYYVSMILTMLLCRML